MKVFTSIAAAAAAIAAVSAWSGCATPKAVSSGIEQQHTEIVLREGDVIRIGFPGAPNLDVPQQPIRRDGKISVPLAGTVTAAGLTPTELQHQLLAQLSDQLVTKEVTVAVLASTFDIKVDGAVLHPGPFTTDRPITALEAIMQAGGFDYSKANTRKVTVIRVLPNGKGYSRFELDLKAILDGKDMTPFFLAPGDMVHVPEKFNPF